MKKIHETRGLIFGRGFLGSRISESFGFAIPSLNVLDMEKLEQYLDEYKPEVVINCVGKTGRPNIDWCEHNKEDTLLSNVAAPIILSSLCSKKKIYFVHLGSGCIYQGYNEDAGFCENDEPTHYGSFYSRTKIMAENILKELPGLQIRLRMPIDDKPGERNFIDKIKNYKKLIDTKNSMTTIPDLLTAMKVLIENRRIGIYNVVNPGTISPAEIMQMYKEIIDPSLKFEIITSDELDGMVDAKRSNCMLNTNKLEREGIYLPEIHEAVKKCLENYKRFLK